MATSATSVQASSLVFYSMPNYAGTALRAVHGQTGIVASSSISWAEQSVSVPGTDNMYTFIWSSVDTGNPTLSYTNHVEQYVTDSIPNMASALPDPQYPLQFLGIDATLAVPVFVQLSGEFAAQNCFASSSLVPGSSSSVSTFTSFENEGAIAFIQNINGASTLASLMIGTLDDASGMVSWSGSGSVMLVYNNDTLTFSSVSGLPESWSFNNPVLQADGSWLVTLTAGKAVDTGTLFSGASYSGTSQILNPHQSVQANSGSGWLWRSIKLYDMPVLLYSSFNPIDTAFDYTEYQLVRMNVDTPDFATLFTGHAPAQLLALDNTDIQLNVTLSTTDTEDEVMAITQHYPSTFYSAVTRGHTGLLAVMPSSGSVQTLSLQSGTLNADGTANFSISGSFTVSFTGGVPVITSGTGIPGNWSFSDPAQQADGTWLVVLSDATLPATAEIDSLTSDKTSIENNGIDTAVFSANVIDTASGLALADVSVEWKTTLGNLSASATLTNSSGVATVTLTDTGDIGTATVMARISNGSSKSYDIEVTTSKSFAIIRGARGCSRGAGQLQTGCLAALDPLTLRPLSVVWRYQNSADYTISSYFIDTHPDEYLEVSNINGDTLTLNVANIIGNGEWKDDLISTGAFAAKLNNGSYVGWGVTSKGGYTLPASINHDVRSLYATYYSFAALRDDRSVIAWGDETEGGDIPASIAGRLSIVDIRGSRGTYALRSLIFPYIQTWGWGVDDGQSIDLSVPDNIAAMSDIQTIIANENAFAVINRGGELFAWGSENTGGTVPQEISILSGIDTCCASRRAFAVIANGAIKAWGDTDYGGDASAVRTINNASRLVATESAYTAILSNGGITCWGNSTYGNSLPTQYKSRNDIIDVKSTYGAFAALCLDGTVIAWGNAAYGGDASAVASLLTDIVALSANSSSFAALTRSGRVITWGDSATGGRNSFVPGLNNVAAIYSNTRAFAALKTDDSLFVWGDASSGVIDFPAEVINGNISYYVN